MEKVVEVLQWLLGDREGYIAIGFRSAREERAWQDHYFEYVGDRPLEDVVQYLAEHVIQGDLYFCPTVLVAPKRVKANIQVSHVLWSDLDECDPALLRVEPTLLIQSSPGRWQAYWMLDKYIPAQEAEALNRRIAYAHAPAGADKSGWDLTQYLRIPQTRNFKRMPAVDTVRVVGGDTSARYSVSDFDVYPVVEGTEVDIPPFPAEDAFPKETSEELLDVWKTSIHPRAYQLYGRTPKDDWSNALWQLELMLFDMGATPVEVFHIAAGSACNKYIRDGHTNWKELLWAEVHKAKKHVDNRTFAIAELDNAGVWEFKDKRLLTSAEATEAELTPCFIDDYVEWAKAVGDAAPQYHIAGAFTILSSLLSSAVRLPTSFGMVLPNMWFMILADTTLTRKTTAMDLAVDLVVEIDPDAIMATDGSIEGLMQMISMRPGKPSIFLRDEFSGLLDQMANREYMSGMLETFTKLYDGKFQKRVLRKEVIEVREPILILFVGGIKSRILEQLSYHHVVSGFLPRFCFITADTDIARMRPLGPPTEKVLHGRDVLLDRLKDLYDHYNPPLSPNQLIRPLWDVSLTPEAWQRYNEFEADMMEIALASSVPDLMTPMLARLTTSGLKAACLLSASQGLKDRVVVDLPTLIKAFSYVDQWKQHAIAVVANAGKTPAEKILEMVYEYIEQNYEVGAARSTIMQRFRLTAREASNVFDTLEQRGLIKKASSDRGTVYLPTRITGRKKPK